MNIKNFTPLLARFKLTLGSLAPLSPLGIKAILGFLSPVVPPLIVFALVDLLILLPLLSLFISALLESQFDFLELFLSFSPQLLALSVLLHNSVNGLFYELVVHLE